MKNIFMLVLLLRSNLAVQCMALFFLLFLTPFAQAKNPVVIISLDAFAQQYITKYHPPHLLKLMHQGIYAKALIPVFPSKTFPNHLSIVTGTYTAKHGIIHNSFYRRDLAQYYYKGAGKDNSSWIKAMPIWTLAEKHGVKAAVYFWPESEDKYQGYSPTYNFPYNKHTPNEVRIKQIINWLTLPKPQRPEFIASYFSLVDTAGHKFGPDSPQVKKAVLKADNLIGELMLALKTSVTEPVDLIVVSDHGMTKIDPQHAIKYTKILPVMPNVKVINGETQILLYSNDQAKMNWLYQLLRQAPDPRFTVYKQSNFPTHWHWINNANALPDLVLNANTPYTFLAPDQVMNKATHGFDPLNNKQMEAIFIAAGPSFQHNKAIPAFENIHIFPMLATLLGLPIPSNIDGKKSVLAPYLINSK